MKNRYIDYLGYGGTAYPCVQICCNKGEEVLDATWVSTEELKRVLAQDITSPDPQIKALAESVYRSTTFFMPERILLGPRKALIAYLIKHLYSFYLEPLG